MKHLVLITVESYREGTFSAILRTAEKRRDYTRYHGELERIKEFYSSDTSVILSHNWDESLKCWEWYYLSDWGGRLSEFRDEEWTLSESTVKSLLTEEEFQSLWEEGILEPFQCYLEPHQKRDGYWYPALDYFTRVNVL